MSAARCPQCGLGLDPGEAGADGMLTCECGFRTYAGYVSELDYLDQRRAWLDARIREGGEPPDPATASTYGIWQAGTASAAAPTTNASRPGQAVPTQIVLLSLGAGLLIIAGIVFVAVTWQRLGAWGQIAVMALITAVAIGTAVALRHRVPRTAEALAVVGFAMVVIDAAAAPAMGLVPDDFGTLGHPYTTAVATVLCAAGIFFGRRLGLRAWSWLGWWCAPVVAASAVAQSTRPTESSHLELSLAGILFATLALALVLLARTQPEPDRSAAFTVGGFSAAVTAGATAFLLPYSPPWGAVAVVAGALVALAIMWRATRATAWLIVMVPLAAFEFTLLTQLLPNADAQLVASVILGAALLFTVARYDEILALLSAALLWISALALTLPEASQISWWCFAVGAVLIVFALVGHAPAVVWIAVVLWQIALTIQLRPIEPVEEFTLPLAALLLGAGLVQRRAGPTSSAIVYGPAVTMALIPSAFVTWTDPWQTPSLIRFFLVMGAGMILLIIGIRKDLLGVFVPGAVAVAIAATAQIWATLETLPRWLALAVAGTALIVIAARIEWVREQRDAAGQWFKQLH